MSQFEKKLSLPNVTLLAAASVDIEQTNFNLKISSENIEFAAVKLLSSSLPNKKFTNIKYISIPQMNLSDYNRLIIEDLHKYFNTSHCLIVQSDSFVVNYERWTEEFLKFDYIGAPWTNKVQMNPKLILSMEKNLVGNGGFSLRSRKLVEATEKINYNRGDHFTYIDFPLYKYYNAKGNTKKAQAYLTDAYNHIPENERTEYLKDDSRGKHLHKYFYIHEIIETYNQSIR